MSTSGGRYVRHHASLKAAHPKVMASGTVPYTQNSVAYNGNQFWDVVPMMTSAPGATEGTQLTWNISPVSDAWTALDETFINFKGYFQLANSVAAGSGTNDSVTTIAMFQQWLMDNVVIEINGVPVIQSQGRLSPLCSVTNIVMNEPYFELEQSKVTRAYSLDDPGFGAASGVLTGNDGGQLRQDDYMQCNLLNFQPEDRPFSVIVRLSDYIRTSEWLPPNTSIRISARRNKDIELVQGAAAEVANANPVYTSNSMDVYVSRKKMRPNALADYMAAWQVRPRTITFENFRGQSFLFPAGQNTANIVGALGGPTPKYVVAWVTNEAGLVGTGTGDDQTIATNLAPEEDHIFTNTYLTLGSEGRTTPLRPINLNNAPDINNNTLEYAELYQLYRQVARKSFLQDRQFENIMPIVFPIGMTDIGDGGWDEADEVNINFTTTLAGPGTTYNWAVVLVAAYTNILSINDVGEVRVD